MEVYIYIKAYQFMNIKTCYRLHLMAHTYIEIIKMYTPMKE